MKRHVFRARWEPVGDGAPAAFMASRREAARLLVALCERSWRLESLGCAFPSKARWQRWARGGRYPGLAAQSVQQLIGEFCRAVRAVTVWRDAGYATLYPWERAPREEVDVPYTGQDARFQEGDVLRLPNGTSGMLLVRALGLPVGTASRRLVWVSLRPEEVVLRFAVPAATRSGRAGSSPPAP